MHYKLRECISCPLRRAAVEPNPFHSLEEFEKFYNIDLRTMSPAELARERDQLRLALLCADRPAAWAARRLAEVERRLAGEAVKR